MSAISVITTKLKLVSVDWVRLLMVLLTLSGFCVSIYLMWGYTTPGASLACGGSHGCDTVKNSVYANLMGIPLPVIGLASYSILLLLLIGQNQAAISDRGWSAHMALAIFGISLAGVLYSAYLTYLELFVIYAICRWCVASAIIMVAIFFLSMLNLRSSNQS
jgi:uncharacterized membrane protein